MTSLHELALEAEPFAVALAAHDIAITPTELLPDVSGPFTTVQFTSPDRPGFVPVVVAVTAETTEDVADAIFSATGSATPQLTGSSPLSAATLEELRADSGTESFHAISAGGETTGVLFLRSDRRSDQSTADLPNGATHHTVDVTSRPQGDFRLLSDVALDVSVELGRDRLTLAQIMNLTVGSVVELDRPAGSPVDIRVNGILFGRGEVVVVDDEYAVRIVEIVQAPGAS